MQFLCVRQMQSKVALVADHLINLICYQRIREYDFNQCDKIMTTHPNLALFAYYIYIYIYIYIFSHRWSTVYFCQFVCCSSHYQINYPQLYQTSRAFDITRAYIRLYMLFPMVGRRVVTLIRFLKPHIIFFFSLICFLTCFPYFCTFVLLVLICIQQFFEYIFSYLSKKKKKLWPSSELSSDSSARQKRKGFSTFGA